jgi:hypothetical protein
MLTEQRNALDSPEAFVNAGAASKNEKYDFPADRDLLLFHRPHGWRNRSPLPPKTATKKH